MSMTKRLWSVNGLATELGRDRRTVASALADVPEDGTLHGHKAWHLTTALRVLDPEPDQYVVDRARAATAAAFPVFRNTVVAESWGGMIDVMPDAIPVIAPVDTLPGFFVATGFSGHGFGIGPGAGKLVADMVAGDPTLVDPAPFRLTRFTDGSNPRPHPLAS